MDRTTGFKERRYIEELRILTKATALDCIIDERFERIIYIIRPGDMGLAIGKKGENIRRMQNVLGKRIEMVEYAENRDDFIANIFRPISISRIEKDPKSGLLTITLMKRSDLGTAIGKKGANIEKARILVRRFWGEELGELKVEEGDL
ncbi:MAG TPA: NusA-like transcription termination signal-binding factor [Methanoregulaceae archaeon]|nr:MAG: NusA-like transcription termination signal-binding factor [Methanolinea sp.]HON81275.1 NusA-like transcription termination signal-binding factor [Methanoregulaceae archaeon]HPD10119.1 NusA-like transcription termination signal-binding factor [Methanoregulaceae archaeon]HRT15125.1 NusA-like transcription termination signal-binding factor [Methanoregulaceae archaeon]HRU30758.1 NusA-like transcription termination signal-binding factor [Methanoregulaceae archaeon]